MAESRRRNVHEEASGKLEKSNSPASGENTASVAVAKSGDLKDGQQAVDGSLGKRLGKTLGLRKNSESGQPSADDATQVRKVLTRLSGERASSRRVASAVSGGMKGSIKVEERSGGRSSDVRRSSSGAHGRLKLIKKSGETLHLAKQAGCPGGAAAQAGQAQASKPLEEDGETGKEKSRHTLKNGQWAADGSLGKKSGKITHLKNKPASTFGKPGDDIATQAIEPWTAKPDRETTALQDSQSREEASESAHTLPVVGEFSDTAGQEKVDRRFLSSPLKTEPRHLFDPEEARRKLIHREREEARRKQEEEVRRLRELAEQEAARERERAEQEERNRQQQVTDTEQRIKQSLDVPSEGNSNASVAVKKRGKEKKSHHGEGRSEYADKQRRRKGFRRSLVVQEKGKFDPEQMEWLSSAGGRRKPGNKSASREEELFVIRDVEIPENISVGDLSHRMSIKPARVTQKLMEMGIIATISQFLDRDTAQIIVEECGHRAKHVYEDALEKAHEATLDVKGEQVVRPPVVTVMGHVNHGKTSLLDRIRKTNKVAQEAGSITQHIGAYRVATDHGEITFMDTPGHSAFTAMRARGAQLTDIVILVVAADDGVMPQTEEAIQHAREAGVPVVVAINKMDKQGVDPEKIHKELASRYLVSEQWGGDTMFVKVSAQTGQGIDDLLEAIMLQAELLEIKAMPEAPGQGVVIESRLDRQRGSVVTLLITNGTLCRGDFVAIGQSWGRVRAMHNEWGESLSAAGPSVPVEILGLNAVPEAGNSCAVVASEKKARELVEARIERAKRADRFSQKAVRLEDIFGDKQDIDRKKSLNLLLKADTRGSAEAIRHAMTDFDDNNVDIAIMSSGVGGITETDANFAVASDAVIFGFNVRADARARKIIERHGIHLRYYSVIYDLLEDVKKMVSDLEDPAIRERIVGIAQVREVFRSPKFGLVAGCLVTEGTVYRNKPIRVLRDDVVIYRGELESLRRYKVDVAEVRNGSECGIGVRNYNDVRIGDMIEVYTVHDSKEASKNP